MDTKTARYIYTETICSCSLARRVKLEDDIKEETIVLCGTMEGMDIIHTTFRIEQPDEYYNSLQYEYMWVEVMQRIVEHTLNKVILPSRE